MTDPAVLFPGAIVLGLLMAGVLWLIRPRSPRPGLHYYEGRLDPVWEDQEPEDEGQRKEGV